MFYDDDDKFDKQENEQPDQDLKDKDDNSENNTDKQEEETNSYEDKQSSEDDVDESLSLKPLFDYSNKEIRLNEGQFEEEILNTNEIDLDNFIYQTVTLSFPNKIVCDINCNGSEKVNQYIKTDFTDPRLEIFKKIKTEKE